MVNGEWWVQRLGGLLWRRRLPSLSQRSRAGAGRWSIRRTPDLPIAFDPELNEYIFEFPSPCSDGACDGAKASMRIYHCFFCGGAAPLSKRGRLFATVAMAERRRVNRLFKGLRTLAEVVERMGPPDEDNPDGMTVERPEKHGKAPTVRTYRVLRYTRLSDTADVDV